MRADSAREPKFVLAALAWSLGLFALLRSPSVERGLVLPLTSLQAQAADYYTGRPRVPVAVTAECSGTDVLALCLAVILACPVRWRTRLMGAVGGMALVLAMNTVRIATLGHVAGSPELFRVLHLQVWPAILVLATAGYVFAWMGWALRSPAAGATGGTRDDAPGASALAPLLRRFAPRAAVLLVAFALCGPWIARSERLVAVGSWTAGMAAVLLTTVGVAAAASRNVLATSRGSFVVTPECLATALIPLYVAGVLAANMSWARRALALVAALPLFALLAVARLMVLALPPMIAASPLFLVHGFHQVVVGIALVVLLALWRESPPGRAARRAGVALAGAAILSLLAGTAFANVALGAARVMAWVVPHTLTVLAAPGETQGALALLPAYQAGLLIALGLTAFPGWRRFLLAFGLLLLSQLVLFSLIGEMATHAGLATHAVVLRFWAVAVPVILALMFWRAGSRPAGGSLASEPRNDGGV